MIDLITAYKGSTHITAAEDGARHYGTYGSGLIVLSGVNDACAYQIISNNSLRIKAGEIIAQGRHIEITGYEDVTIENGTQEMYRNDLVVIHYEKNTTTGVESASLVVKKGTETSGTPTDPSYTSGNILDGDTTVEIPLYRVYIAGLTLTTVTALFSTVPSIKTVNDTLTAHAANTSNPHSTTAAQVGADASGTAAGLLNRTTAVNIADTNYTTYMARGEALNSSDTTPTANGCISWTYE